MSNSDLLNKCMKCSQVYSNDCQAFECPAVAANRLAALGAPKAEGGERKLVEWVFEQCVVNGYEIDGGEAQEKLLSLALIEERPVNPDENEWGATELYFLKDIAAFPVSQPAEELVGLAKATEKALKKMRRGWINDADMSKLEEALAKANQCIKDQNDRT